MEFLLNVSLFKFRETRLKLRDCKSNLLDDRREKGSNVQKLTALVVNNIGLSLISNERNKSTPSMLLSKYNEDEAPYSPSTNKYMKSSRILSSESDVGLVLKERAHRKKPLSRTKM